MGIGNWYQLISGVVNDPETKGDFKATCLLNKGLFSTSDQCLSQDDQKYSKLYHKSALLYLTREVKNRTQLLVYDTESKRIEAKIMYTPRILDLGTCITQLPNGGLFCYGKYPASGIALIIDNNYYGHQKMH